jgi:predicted dehydrogenase
MLSIDFPASDGSEIATVAQISSGHYLPSVWKEATSFRPPAGLQVCCENGVAFVDLPSNLVWFDSAGRHQESLERDRPVGEQLLSQFHRAVTSLIRRQDDLNDAYRALDIVLLGKKSRELGQRIQLDS